MKLPTRDQVDTHAKHYVLFVPWAEFWQTLKSNRRADRRLHAAMLHGINTGIYSFDDRGVYVF